MIRIKPVIKYLLLGTLVLVILILWSLPLLAEYLIEKNDTEWFGREVEVADIDLNLFTGKMVLYEGTFYEQDGVTPFVSFGLLETNVEMTQLINSVYSLEYLLIQKPFVRIAQSGAQFNFDDLITGEADSIPAEESEPVKYRIQNVTLTEGSFSYEDTILPSLLQLERINISIPMISDEFPGVTYAGQIFQKGGGEVTIDGAFNWQDEAFSAVFDMNAWELTPYQNYLNSYLNIKYFGGELSLKGTLGGSYSESQHLASSGVATLSNFILVDAQADSLIRFKNLIVHVDTVNTQNQIYSLGTSLLEKPEILFKYFENGDNFTNLYLDTTTDVTIDTMRVVEEEIVFENPFQYITDYISYFFDEQMLYAFEADSVLVSEGKLVFQDYSHLEDALVVLDNIRLQMKKVTKTDSALVLDFTSRVNQSGELLGDLSFQRSDLSNYAMNFDVQNFYVSAFDPYSKHYTAHPMWEGALNLTSKTSVINDYITSDNRLLIVQPQVGKKLDINAEYNIPLRFAFGLLKDVEGNIDLKFPIEGDLNDPEYKLGKVVIKVLLNLLSKAVASPYNLLARALDADEEDLKAIRFEHDQDSLDRAQFKSMDLLVRVLENKEDLVASLEYAMDEKKEKDEIALTFAKKQFWNDLPDSVRMSVYDAPSSVGNRDSLFVNYLDQKVGGLGSRSIAQMAMSLMGEEVLQQRIDYLKERHLGLVRSYLYEEKAMDSTRVKIKNSEDPEKIAAIVRPTFFILYDAGNYEQEEQYSSTTPPGELLLSPVMDDKDSIPR
jgi:hypothetical protein